MTSAQPAPAEKDDINRAAIQLAEEALERKRQSLDWRDWLTIGVGFDEGRRWAMRASHSNQPAGRGYNEAFSSWLKQTTLHCLDKPTRAELLACMDNRHEIEAWRATLSENKRMEWNHPRTVMRHWRASLKSEADPGKAGKITRASGMHAALAVLERERDALQARVKEFEKREQDGSTFASQDHADMIAQAIANELRVVWPGKFRQIVEKLNAHCVKHAQAHARGQPRTPSSLKESSNA